MSIHGRPPGSVLPGAMGSGPPGLLPPNMIWAQTSSMKSGAHCPAPDPWPRARLGALRQEPRPHYGAAALELELRLAAFRAQGPELPPCQGLCPSLPPTLRGPAPCECRFWTLPMWVSYLDDVSSGHRQSPCWSPRHPPPPALL